MGWRQPCAGSLTQGHVAFDYGQPAERDATGSAATKLAARGSYDGGRGWTFDRLRSLRDMASGEQVEVAWKEICKETGGQLVELPTYAFQRQRFWLQTPKSGQKDAPGLGLQEAQHPLLGSATSLPGSVPTIFAGTSLPSSNCT